MDNPNLMVIADRDIAPEDVERLREAMDLFRAEIAEGKHRAVVVSGGMTVCQLVDGRWVPVLPPECPHCGAKLGAEPG